MFTFEQRSLVGDGDGATGYSLVARNVGGRIACRMTAYLCCMGYIIYIAGPELALSVTPPSILHLPACRSILPPACSFSRTTTYNPVFPKRLIHNILGLACLPILPLHKAVQDGLASVPRPARCLVEIPPTSVTFGSNSVASMLSLWPGISAKSRARHSARLILSNAQQRKAAFILNRHRRRYQHYSG